MADYIAVAIVADSSAALAEQWPLALTEYILPMFHRLVEQRAQLVIGFVTYALAEITPSPVVAKRYFSMPPQMTRELKEEAGKKLLLGTTSTGGKQEWPRLRGMLQRSRCSTYFRELMGAATKRTPQNKPDAQPRRMYHIIHVCAGAPDGRINPMHNQLTDFDGLSWKTLPDELKKRNINLNMVLLRRIQPFIDLHNATVTEPCKPWYNVRSNHLVLLSTQGVWASPNVKRKEEQPIDTSPESKRARIDSPKLPLSSPAVPALQPKLAQPLESRPQPSAASTSTSAQPQAAPPPTAAAAPGPGHANLNGGVPAHPPAMEEKLRNVELQLRAQYAQMMQLQRQGRTAEAESIRKTITPKIEMFNRFKKIMLASKAAENAKAGNANGAAIASSSTNPPNSQAPAGPTSSLNKASNSGSVSAPASVPPQTHVPPSSAPSDTQSLAAFVQARQQASQAPPEPKPAPNPAGPNAPPGAGGRSNAPGFPPVLPTNLAEQMQKLASKEGIAGQGQMPSLKTPNQTRAQLPVQNQGQQGQPGLGHAPGPGPSSVAQPQQQRQKWEGTITWIGREKDDLPTVKMEAQVVATAIQDPLQSNIRSDLWPPVLDLRPSHEHGMNTHELKAWMTLHKPMLCSFSPVATNPDNVRRFRSFVQLLFDKSMYAIGSWAVPGTNVPRPTILIFPTGNVTTVVGAVFPETGIPDLPKAGPSAAPQQPRPTPNLPANSPAAAAFLQRLANDPRINFSQLSSLPPEQQRAAMEKLAMFAARMKQQHQMQQQAQAAGAGNTGLAQGMNRMAINAPGVGSWPAQNNLAGITQGFNLGLNNMAGPSQSPNAQQRPNFGYSGVSMNMGQNPQMPQQQQSGIPATNMNLMNLNLNAGMQLGTLGGLGNANPLPGAMQQQHQQQGMPGAMSGVPGQGAAPPLSGDTVQSFLQRNGLGGGGMR